MKFARYPNVRQLLEHLEAIEAHRELVGFDIEGYPQSGVTDLSFALSPTEVLWVPFRRGNGKPWWSPEEETAVWTVTRRILESAAVPKACHNGLYEAFCLKWAHDITLAGMVEDTMLLWHELYAELEKALDVPVSLLTRQPYWKHGITATEEPERAAYNCTDSAVTLEICQIMHGLDADGNAYLTPQQIKHYRFNMRLLEPCLWQMLKGMNYDMETAREMGREYAFNMYAFQGELDRLAGILPPQFAEVVKIVCLARRSGDVTNWGAIPEFAKPSWREAI